jgi:hypothetical protein
MRVFKKGILVLFFSFLFIRLSAGNDFCGINNLCFAAGEVVSFKIFYNLMNALNENPKIKDCHLLVHFMKFLSANIETLNSNPHVEIIVLAGRRSAPILVQQAAIKLWRRMQGSPFTSKRSTAQTLIILRNHVSKASHAH